MSTGLFGIVLQALAVIIGIVVHESAHSLAAWALGDSTARSQGRVSLNPLKHVDPFGTVLLPLLMMAAGGPVFAFAKPVPVYLGNLKHPKRDEVLVAFAGPASNLVLACLGAAGCAAVAAGWGALGAQAGNALLQFFATFVAINLSLAFFNLIPLPPLDGSSILVPFLRGRALEQYYKVQRYAMPILIVVLYVLPTLLHLDVIGLYFSVTVYPLYSLLLGLAGVM